MWDTLSYSQSKSNISFRKTSIFLILKLDKALINNYK